MKINCRFFLIYKFLAGSNQNVALILFFVDFYVVFISLWNLCFFSYAIKYLNVLYLTYFNYKGFLSFGIVLKSFKKVGLGAFM